ncbi:LLM class flavin-dependent oxidoreductase [Pseudonocardia xinjiangensis]|jgi:alkanesulfonate monooxygenase SsuD/methylene tetrahydromethanopterin reductase-like flavin-dependent oxidoreductase (luciferase family)|uniref:LLM class flavin-dependent oxidoreductase n=1 Tax=Pseudonocardia xinjiangensis TaxID=75289 RepID=UPI003D944309
MKQPTLGVTFRPQSPPERLREVALAAEAAGVSELWLWEDCFLEGGLTAATAALAWTERLHVGIGLLPVPLRNPAVTAMEIATLARLFPGRFMPGLGHGVLDWMAQVGARAASPMTLLREHSSAVYHLLHGRTLDVDGRFVHLEQVTLEYPPYVVPPLLIGGRGPKTLRLAGDVADGVILDCITSASQVRDARRHVAEGRSAGGRTGPFRTVVYIELDTASAGLQGQVADWAGQLGAVGADSVVFQATGENPDPRPLLEACGSHLSR